MALVSFTLLQKCLAVLSENLFAATNRNQITPNAKMAPTAAATLLLVRVGAFDARVGFRYKPVMT